MPVVTPAAVPDLEAIDFAERRYRSLIGKRIAHTGTDGRTLTGTVLRGLFRLHNKPEAPRWFRVRSREIWYARLDLAPRMRPAPIKKRRAAP
jgi:hypothetical protein